MPVQSHEAHERHALGREQLREKRFQCLDAPRPSSFDAGRIAATGMGKLGS